MVFVLTIDCKVQQLNGIHKILKDKVMLTYKQISHENLSFEKWSQSELDILNQSKKNRAMKVSASLTRKTTE